MFVAFKIVFSACLIAFASWLSGKRPELAGFLTALPLVTLLVLPFSYVEYQNPENSVLFARSILAALPFTVLFFVPFLAATRLNWGFWSLYAAGIALLAGGYFAHRWIMGLMQG